jgi:aspartyl-tRNA(Asn)/glutamyl-tRNA(Gln) amidotransferase subunit B
MSWQKKYTPVIGLEVHTELKTISKMFCACANDPFNAKKPNIYTCPVCLGMPGGLPVPNSKAIEWTIKVGLATKCKINHFSKFDRKHYFYPDLAKGYQISQYDLPLCFNGQLTTSAGPVGIRRIHLEEDTGKLLHKTVNGKKVTLVDFNRSGVPLIEIVTEPDLTSGTQAKEFGKKLRQLLRFLDVADGDMEQGGLRLEANISLRHKNKKQLPTYKVEIKNINSFRFMEQAIDFELDRQAKLLETGQTPKQETRGWDATNNKTFSQRSKEEAEDYRYLPEPDIPPLNLNRKFVAQIKKSLPVLPEEMVEQWHQEFAVPKTLLSNAIISMTSSSELTWLGNNLKNIKLKNYDNNMFINDLINKKIKVSPKLSVKQVVAEFEKLHAVEEINPTELEQIIKLTLQENLAAVEKYQAGQTQVLGFLIGQVLQKLDKKIDPKVVRQALEASLEAS